MPMIIAIQGHYGVVFQPLMQTNIIQLLYHYTA